MTEALKVYCGKKFFQARLADTFLAKTRGIMFSAPSFAPLLIEFAREARATNAIHSLFCPRFDAVFLNAGKKVVDLKRVEPFKLWVAPRAPAKYVLELPAGRAPRAGIRVGKKLFWNRVTSRERQY